MLSWQTSWPTKQKNITRKIFENMTAKKGKMKAGPEQRLGHWEQKPLATKRKEYLFVVHNEHIGIGYLCAFCTHIHMHICMHVHVYYVHIYESFYMDIYYLIMHMFTCIYIYTHRHITQHIKCTYNLIQPHHCPVDCIFSP